MSQVIVDRVNPRVVVLSVESLVALGGVDAEVSK